MAEIVFSVGNQTVDKHFKLKLHSIVLICRLLLC